jgi:periplasmic divalent cation tolerance protein
MAKKGSGVIIVSTFPTEESVLKEANEFIVNKKICACINLTKVRSVYYWNDRLENHEEFVALFKTTKASSAKLKAEIKRIHPYDVPEVVELKMNDVSKGYLSWMIESTTRAKKGRVSI